jgi:hypothetical protein
VGRHPQSAFPVNHGDCLQRRRPIQGPLARLVHKLIPANDKQRNPLDVARRLICWLDGSSKEYKLAPSPKRAEAPRARFVEIFKRAGIGEAALDRPLGRLFRNKAELFLVHDRPEMPHSANTTEYDIHASVRKRKSSVSRQQAGSVARDVMLGRYKTFRKLRQSF